MIAVLIESALRALLVALTVGAGLRLFRVTNVLAQKAAWSLMLVSAVAMPLLMRWQVLPASMAFRVPAPPRRLTAGSLPIPGVLPLSAHADGLVNGPRAKLVTAIQPHPSTSSGSPAPSFARSEFDPSARPAQAPFGQTSPAQAWPAPVATRQTRIVQPQAATLLSTIAGWAAGLRFRALGRLAGFLYLAVGAVLLLRMVYGLAMAARLWLVSDRFEPEPGPDPANDPARGVRLRFSFSVSSPVTIGSGILLPANCLGWDREKLRIVLAHERAHVRQGDFYLQLLAGAYTAVFWFSPLGWWLKSKLCDLGEAISDHAGLEEAASRASYAQVLLEFAALPRPTAIGVAMARSTNLSHRIERLLNETIFRQAFAGTRRLLLAVLLVPVALFAGTALIRVEAAASGQAVPPPPAPAPAAAPTPDAAPAVAAAPNAPAATQLEPGGPAEPAVPPPPADPAPMPPPGQAPAAVPPVAPDVVPVAAVPPMPAAPTQYGAVYAVAADRYAAMVNFQNDSTTNTNTNANGKHTSTSVGKGYSYSYSSDGDSWALVTDPSERVTFSGDWHNSTRESLEKVRKLTNGKFLWFTHDGKSYFLDDPALIAQIQEMYKPMEELGRQQDILGKQQDELGRRQEELGRKQELASVPTPDISKEMAKLNEAVAKLDAKKGSTVSEEEIADIEGKIGDIQGKLGELQGEMGSRQGELGAQQGKLGEQQGKLGEQQGRLGAEQGRIASEADRKVKSIINESLRNGKARPVE
jgi:beta-lactamase regulating signal transducer with metallopeptidase domain